MQEEYDQYHDFKATRDRDPASRYHYLKHLGDTPDAPYSESPRTGGYPLRPNVTFTGKATKLNAQRLVHLVARGEQCTESRVPFVLSNLLGCQDINDSSSAALEQKMSAYLKHFSHLKTFGPWVSHHSARYEVKGPSPYASSHDNKVVMLASLGIE